MSQDTYLYLSLTIIIMAVDFKENTTTRDPAIGTITFTIESSHETLVELKMDAQELKVKLKADVKELQNNINEIIKSSSNAHEMNTWKEIDIINYQERIKDGVLFEKNYNLLNNIFRKLNLEKKQAVIFLEKIGESIWVECKFWESEKYPLDDYSVINIKLPKDNINQIPVDDLFQSAE